MLVNYDDSDQEEQQTKVEEPKKKVKVVDIQELMKISKKVKGNTGEAIKNVVEDDQWDPDNIIKDKDDQTLSTGQTKFMMNLPQPKQKEDRLNNFTNFIPNRRKVPPPPPGMSFSVAETLTKILLKKEDDDALREIEEYDDDDVFIKDLKKLKHQDTFKYVDVGGEDLDILKQRNEIDAGQEKLQMIEINGEDLQNLDWRGEQEKRLQAQEMYMKWKAPDQNPSQRQKDKNHISSLLFQAAQKEEEFDIRKQDQRHNQQKVRDKYGW